MESQRHSQDCWHHSPRYHSNPESPRVGRVTSASHLVLYSVATGASVSSDQRLAIHRGRRQASAEHHRAADEATGSHTPIGRWGKSIDRSGSVAQLAHGVTAFRRESRVATSPNQRRKTRSAGQLATDSADDGYAKMSPRHSPFFLKRVASSAQKLNAGHNPDRIGNVRKSSKPLVTSEVNARHQSCAVFSTTSKSPRPTWVL